MCFSLSLTIPLWQSGEQKWLRRTICWKQQRKKTTNSNNNNADDRGYRKETKNSQGKSPTTPDHSLHHAIQLNSKGSFSSVPGEWWEVVYNNLCVLVMPTPRYCKNEPGSGQNQDVSQFSLCHPTVQREVLQRKHWLSFNSPWIT